MMDQLEKQLIKVTEQAAIACYPWIGKGEPKAADGAAVDGMRKAFNQIDIDATVVIGEGERDEAPMLFIGEKVGSGKGKKYDLAVDPLEGTTLCAKNLPNSITVLALAPDGKFLHAPDTYMDKIAVGPKVGNAVSLKNSVKENLEIVSQKLKKPIGKVVVVMLKRDRHKELEKEVRDSGAKIKFIPDGDVFGALSTVLGGSDILLGVGAAPEGVLAAAGLKPLGGYFEGQLKFRNEDEKERAIKYGIKDLNAILTIDDLVKSNESIFVATGVTDGDFLKGVKILAGVPITSSILISNNGISYSDNRICEGI